MAEQHIYNHKDIQRYLQQQMTNEEMHAFERAMMDDPFLADALEGYKISDESIAKKHLADIEQQIKGNKEQSKVVAIPPKKNTWWKVAAMVLIIVMGAAVAYNLLNNSSNPNNSIKDLAQAKKKEAAPIQDSIKQAPSIDGNVENPSLLSDNIKPRSIFPQKPSPPFIKEEQKASIATSATDISSTNAAAPAKPQLEAMRDAELQQTMLRPDSVSVALLNKTAGVETGAMRKMEAFKQQNEFKGRVMDPLGNPIANASVSAAPSNQTLTDAKGNFSIKAQDTSVQVAVNSVGFTAATAKLKSNEADKNIVLQEDKAALNEVVVMGYGRNKKARAPGKDSKASVEPEGGWQNFNHYIDSSLNKAKESKEVVISGDVELEFLVDPVGKPVNIKTTNAADKALEGKAIQLIQKGPKWKTRDKKAKAKVVIQF